jgi:hypothetical protein
MKARSVALEFLVVLTAFVSIPSSVLTDGCFVWQWDRSVDIREPAQKAIILYDKGREDLILQVKVEGNVTDFGWLIPVPGLPEVSEASMNSFFELSRVIQRWDRRVDAGRADKEAAVQVLGYKTVGA